MRNYIISLSILLLWTINITAAEKDLFPEIEGWQRADKIDSYVPETLWDKINGAADNYFSYDFVKLLVADYERENGDYISAEIYEHSNPVMAYGIYASERPSDGQYTSLGAEGYELNGLYHFYSDRYYVKIYTHAGDDEAIAAVRAIAKGINSNINGQNELPALVKSFPQENKIPKSTIFIARNFLGYSFLHSAFSTNYQQDGKRYSVFIIDAGTESGAKEMLSSYLKMLNISSENIQQGRILIEDPFNGDMPLVWKNNLIWGIQNGEKLDNQEEILARTEQQIEANK